MTLARRAHEAQLVFITIRPLLPFNMDPMNGQGAPRSGHSENKLRTDLFDPEQLGELGPCSSTSEYRLALFNKGAARFAVIFRLTTMDVVGSLEVETIVHVSVHGAVQILLHVAIGHCGTRS